MWNWPTDWPMKRVMAVALAGALACVSGVLAGELLAFQIGPWFGIRSAEAQTTPPRPPSSPFAQGQRIASGGGPQGAGAACMTCHGTRGEGEQAAGFPRLAGLGAPYLAKQLDNYADGTRPNDVMTPIALALSDEERRAVSTYYGALPVPPPRRGQAQTQPAGGRGTALQTGGALYAQGSASLGVQACINCHGPGGRGLNTTYPPIAGQPEAYVAAQLHAWKAGQRSNDIAGSMATIAKHLGDDDIAAVSAYVASLAP